MPCPHSEECQKPQPPLLLKKYRLKKTRPFRFLLLASVVLDWFMVNSCFCWWSFTCQNLAVNARSRAETTKLKVTFWQPWSYFCLKKGQGGAFSKLSLSSHSGKRRFSSLISASSHPLPWGLRGMLRSRSLRCGAAPGTKM